jgi:hypothetical protein
LIKSKELFCWRFSPNVIKNKGDIIVPRRLLKSLPKELNISFDGTVHRLKLDPRGRIRGTRSGDAIYDWLCNANLVLGDYIPVYFDDSSCTLIFDTTRSRKSYEPGL